MEAIRYNEKNERLKNGMAAQELWNAKYKNQIVSSRRILGEITKRTDALGITIYTSQMGGIYSYPSNIPRRSSKNVFGAPSLYIFPR